MLQLWLFANAVLCPFSIQLGGFGIWLNVPVLGVAGAAWLKMHRWVAISTANALLMLVAYFILSFVIAANGLCNNGILKSIVTAPALLFLVLIALELGRRAKSCDWLNLQRTATWSLLVAFFAFVVEIAAPSRFPNGARYREKGELSGLFQEPSEVAFTLFPCIAILLVSNDKQKRRIGMLALLGLLIFSRSSTLIALIVAWILYRLLIHRKIYQASSLALGFGALLVIGSTANYSALVAPTVDRIANIAALNEATGASSLVYVQGWQDAWANLVRTHGLGLGFNMMGCQPLPDVPARELLTLGGMGELNAEDGSFQFAKIVSEAGVAGIAFYIAIVWWWIRFEKTIRKIKDHGERCAASTQAALIFCFIASSFIRGGSYFSGGILLWLVAVAGASKWRRNPMVIPLSGARASNISPEPHGIAGCE